MFSSEATMDDSDFMIVSALESQTFVSDQCQIQGSSAREVFPHDNLFDCGDSLDFNELFLDGRELDHRIESSSCAAKDFSYLEIPDSVLQVLCPDALSTDDSSIGSRPTHMWGQNTYGPLVDSDRPGLLAQSNSCPSPFQLNGLGSLHISKPSSPFNLLNPLFPSSVPIKVEPEEELLPVPQSVIVRRGSTGSTATVPSPHTEMIRRHSISAPAQSSLRKENNAPIKKSTGSRSVNSSPRPRVPRSKTPTFRAAAASPVAKTKSASGSPVQHRLPPRSQPPSHARKRSLIDAFDESLAYLRPEGEQVATSLVEQQGMYLVRVQFQDQHRSFWLPSCLSAYGTETDGPLLSDLEGEVLCVLGWALPSSKPFLLKYRDEENDWVCLFRESDWTECRSLADMGNREIDVMVSVFTRMR